MPHNPYDGPTKGSGIDCYHTTQHAAFTCWKCGAMISETVTMFVDDYGMATTESQCPSCDFVAEYEFKLTDSDE